MSTRQIHFGNFNIPKRNRNVLLSLFVCAFVAVGGVVQTSAESLVERFSTLESADALTARGVIVANAEVTFSSILSAPISKMPLKAGSPFKKGTMHVQFDCGKTEAELRGAEASQGKQFLILGNRKKLKLRNAASAFEVLEAQADYQVAKSQSDKIKEVMKICQIDAPFNGKVLEVHANEHELPGLNSPLITVIDDSILELDLIVPSKWLQWISTGSKFEFSIEETNGSYKAVVTRLGAKVDAVSQTIKITGTIEKSPA